MSDININFNIEGWSSSLAGLAFLGLKDPVQAIGAILRDCINEGRTYLQEIFQKCREIRNEKNLNEENLRHINAKFIVSWLQSAMFESDKTLQELWARLLVNAEDKNFENEIKIAFIDIIKTLTPVEVKILEHAYKNMNDRETTINSTEIENKLKINHSLFEASLNNLERCQLLYSLDRNDNGIITKDFTALGIMFVNACMS